MFQYINTIVTLGARGGACDRSNAVQAGRSRVRFPIVSLGFFFHWPNPSGRTIALESTQHLPTRVFCRGKGGRCLGLTAWLPSYADYVEMWAHQPPGTLRACPGCAGIALPFYLTLFTPCVLVQTVHWWQQQCASDVHSTVLYRCFVRDVALCSGSAV
jgi:hypothetical protein